MATKGYQPRDGASGQVAEEAAAGDAAVEATAQGQRLTAPARIDQDRAQRLVRTITQLQTFLRDNLAWAREKQAEYANEHRAPAPRIRVGDWVMLDARNLVTKRPSRSLDFKNRGPFRVTRAIGNTAFELDLLPEMGRLYNVFHVWLLHKYDGELLPGQARDVDRVELEDEE